MHLDDGQIERALGRVAPGLAKYLWIMERVHVCDVTVDREFQRRFNGFYRVRKPPTWQRPFYALMEEAKTRPLSFADVLRAMHGVVGSVEASFTSKLVATLDPARPVWDTHVLRNYGLRKPYPNQRDQLARTIRVYDDLQRRTTDLVGSPTGRRIVEAFRRCYPDAVVSDEKCVDFVLWMHRDDVRPADDAGFAGAAGTANPPRRM